MVRTANSLAARENGSNEIVAEVANCGHANSTSLFKQSGRGSNPQPDGQGGWLGRLRDKQIQPSHNSVNYVLVILGFQLINTDRK